MNRKQLITASALTATTLPAFAHTGVNASHYVIDGLLHPLMGIDHVLVMLAVGLWAVLLGGRALYLLPLSFMSAMLAGSGLAFLGLSFSGAETWVALSVLAAGVMVWRSYSIALYAAMALVSVLALSHGYVHAAELTANADALSYCVGFLASTAVLHGLGIGFGIISKNYVKLVSASFALICTAVGLSLLAGV